MPNRRLDDIVAVSLTLEDDTCFLGRLQGNDNYVIHGEVVGDCDIHGVVILEPDCRWIGNVTADAVVVAGTVQGNVAARDKAEVRASARIHGHLTSPVIAVGDGAVITGALPPASRVSRFRERRRPAGGA